LLLAIVALGAAIRFSTLGEQSFWFDEASTYAVVAHGIGHVVSTIPQTESSPPLYYVLLWLWAQVFGLSEVALRSFSALSGTLLIPAMWALGRRLFSERAGLIAALLIAVNPLLFWYAQEARSYSLLLLLCSLSLLALVRALEQPTPRRLLVWGAISALALTAHYFAAFVLVPEAAWLLAALHRRGELTWGRATLAGGPIVLVAAALAPLAIDQSDGRAGWIANSAGSLPHRLAQLGKQDVIGDGQPHKVLLAVIGAALVLIAVVLLLQRSSRRERAAALLPLAVGAGGVLVALVISAVGTDYFDTRNLLPTWPALALVVAAGLGASRAGRLGYLATGALAALSLYCISNVLRDDVFQRDNWRGGARAVGPPRGPRAIVSDRYHSFLPLQIYLPGLANYPAGGAPVQEVDVIWVGRHGFGNPITPVNAAPLPGFALREVRTSSYIVFIYRASSPVLEQAAALDRLFPEPATSRTMLQGRQGELRAAPPSQHSGR
jgi:4-amino-4-deoxy-L-arabinose transferase-like glycosyltransferase